jgi:type II secretory pathway component PulF
LLRMLLAASAIVLVAGCTTAEIDQAESVASSLDPSFSPPSTSQICAFVDEQVLPLESYLPLTPESVAKLEQKYDEDLNQLYQSLESSYSGEASAAQSQLQYWEGQDQQVQAMVNTVEAMGKQAAAVLAGGTVTPQEEQELETGFQDIQTWEQANCN